MDGDLSVFYLIIDGRLEGIIGIHVDDLIFAGSKLFHATITEKMTKKFQFTKLKEDTFSFTGCMITKLNNGDIKIDQKEYASGVTINDIPEGPSNRKLNAKEIKQYREYIGKLNWLSQLTDPTISFMTHEFSTNVSEAPVGDLKSSRDF